MITIVIDPIFDALIAAAVWWLYNHPKPAINVRVEPSAPFPLSDADPRKAVERDFDYFNPPLPDQHRAAVLHRQADGSWHEIGHAEFGSRENPGERILRELATPGRAIRWPDGTVQEN